MIIRTNFERLARGTNPISLGPYGRISLPPIMVYNRPQPLWMPRQYVDAYALGSIVGRIDVLNDPRAIEPTRRLIASI